ncbi:hypothetical protein ABFS83_01G005500 [Erythranthe nasuta]
MGSSSSERVEGQNMYKEWMSLQEQELTELIHSLNLNKTTATTSDNDAEINALLDKATQSFQDYIERRNRLARRDTSAFFSPRWCSSFESSMLWIAGCRPSSFFNLFYALCGSDIDSRLSQFLQDGKSDEFPQLSPSQLVAIDNLQRRTIVEEEKLTSQFASLQQDKADVPLALIARKLEGPQYELNEDVRETIGEIEKAMVCLMEEADNLRLETFKEMVKILKPVQALEFIIAAKKLRVCVRSWGEERDREHGRKDKE